MAAPLVLTLLGRSYCHLCDEMRVELDPLALRHDARIVEVDVDAHPGLAAAYGERVPVVFLGSPADGIELCCLRFDAERVERALEAQR